MFNTSYASREEMSAITARMLLEIKAVHFRSDEPYIFTSGLASPVYIDCRKLISFPRIRSTLMDFLAVTTMREVGFEAFDNVAGGETAGILRHYRRWYEIDTAAVSFGQGMSVTNVQLATAMSAIANGGKLMKPMLVRRMSDGHGATIDEYKPRVRRQVVPRRVAKLVGQMLTAVTEPGGTAMEAAVDGYLVAGKTGTAQKADYVHGGYAKDKWLASFIGFAPAERPSVVISVVIDEPAIAHYGGTVAGPVFRRIAEVTLRHMGIAPEGRQAVLAKKKEQRIAVVEQAPTPEEEAVEKGQSAVPDVRSLPLRQAVVALHDESLVAEVRGSGVVVSQTPSPGKAVAHGSVVQIQLERRRFDTDAAAPQAPSKTLAAAVPRGPHAR